jgi:hypothetical protein
LSAIQPGSGGLVGLGSVDLEFRNTPAAIKTRKIHNKVIINVVEFGRLIDFSVPSALKGEVIGDGGGLGGTLFSGSGCSMFRIGVSASPPRIIAF